MPRQKLCIHIKHCTCLFQRCQQKDLFSVWAAKGQLPSEKVTRSEEALEETVEEAVEETWEETVETGRKQKAFSGAATYRCTFKSAKMPRYIIHMNLKKVYGLGFTGYTVK